MLSFEDFSEIAMEIHDNFNAFLEIDHELANTGLVKAYDFGEALARCQAIADSLSDLRQRLESGRDQQNGRENIAAALGFLDALETSLAQMAHICERLAAKASGLTKYGLFEYRRDIKEYKRLEKERSPHGIALNSAMRNPF